MPELTGPEIAALGGAYRCPVCAGSLEIAGEGYLACSNGHEFPIAAGIPRFVSEARYTRSFGRQWNRWATTQLDSRNGTTIFGDRFRRYFGPPESLAGLTVLDAGCGAGAFIDLVAPHAAEVWGIDLSDAVEAAHRNSAPFDNVRIAQADLLAPPFADRSFDFVYCIGVLQHTPDPRRAFSSIARLVRPGGRLAVWIYERAPWEPLKPRHLLRAYTTRLGPERAMAFVERYAPRAHRVRRRLAGKPGGRLLRKAIPVADVDDYVGAQAARLSPEEREEWCVMDTHDMLVTTYDDPQRPATVAEWFRAEGFDEPVRGDSEAIAMVAIKRG
jgi:SAM-dependent methyltransferase